MHIIKYISIGLLVWTLVGLAVALLYGQMVRMFPPLDATWDVPTDATRDSLEFTANRKEPTDYGV